MSRVSQEFDVINPRCLGQRKARIIAIAMAVNVIGIHAIAALLLRKLYALRHDGSQSSIAGVDPTLAFPTIQRVSNGCLGEGSCVRAPVFVTAGAEVADDVVFFCFETRDGSCGCVEEVYVIDSVSIRGCRRIDELAEGDLPGRSCLGGKDSGSAEFERGVASWDYGHGGGRGRRRPEDEARGHSKGETGSHSRESQAEERRPRNRSFGTG